MTPIQISDRYEVYKISDKEFESSVKRIMLRANRASHSVLQNLLHFAKNKLSASHAVIERNYIDADFLSEFSLFYSKNFKPYESTCVRIHFFKGEVTKQALLSGTTVESTEYLGYTILTPLSHGKIGRTVLSRNPLPFSSKESSAFVCKAPFFAHIYGHTQEVFGTPFITQDSAVMACAQSAIWMSTFFMHARYGNYGIQRHFPQDIVEASGRFLGWSGRVIPTEGLTIYQMVNSFSNLGYSPIFLHKPPLNTKKPTPELYRKANWNPINSICKYISSEIPVVLTLSTPPHAVAVFGYVLGNELRPGSDPNSRFLSCDEWTSSLIVNDDGLGPYRLMPASTSAQKMLKASSESDLLPNTGSTRWWETTDDIYGLIIPLPREVCISAEYIDPMLRQQIIFDGSMQPSTLLREMDTITQKKQNQYFKMFLDCVSAKVGSDKIVTTSFLLRSSEFLKKLGGRMNEALVSYYQKMEYPLYIWVVELSLHSLRNNEHHVLGEVIIDSTANRHTPAFLSIHLPGIIVLRDVKSERLSRVLDYELDFIDQPYSSHLQKST